MTINKKLSIGKLSFEHELTCSDTIYCITDDPTIAMNKNPKIKGLVIMLSYILILHRFIYLFLSTLVNNTYLYLHLLTGNYF